MAVVSIQHLSKSYGAGDAALNDVSMTIAKGDFFGLLGPNGAGKSTLIGILSTLLKPTSGRVELFGYDISTHRCHIQSKVAVCPQEFNFDRNADCITILINQAGYYGIAKSQAVLRAQSVLQRCDLWEKRCCKSRNLSGGEKRRLMIARALMLNPELLILDEPTAGVDLESRLMIWQWLQEINDSGTTIIFTSHYLEEIERLCRNVSILHQGKLLYSMPMQSLLQVFPNDDTVQLHFHHPIHLSDNFKKFNAELIDDMTMQVILGSTYTLNDLFVELVSHNMHVSHIQNKKSKLEQLFLQLTNHHHEK